MATTKLTETDEGKQVVDVDGEVIGVVSGVRNGAAYVDADPGITDEIRSKLGWDEIDRDDYPLDRSEVDTTTDDEIHLKRVL